MKKQAAQLEKTLTQSGSCCLGSIVAVKYAAKAHHLESLRQVEVQLDGAALPLAPQHILNLDINLGPIEGPSPLIDLVGPAFRVQGLPKGILCLLPDLIAAHCLGRLGGQVNLQLGEAKGAHHILYHVQHAADLTGYLVGQAEDVTIILQSQASSCA